MLFNGEIGLLCITNYYLNNFYLLALCNTKGYGFKEPDDDMGSHSHVSADLEHAVFTCYEQASVFTLRLIVWQIM